MGRICFDLQPGDIIDVSGPARVTVKKKTGPRTSVVVEAESETVITKTESAEPSETPTTFGLSKFASMG